jgi:hypothetical protein
MIDLGDPVVQQALGIEGAFLRQPWKQMRDIERARPPSWDFARAAHAAGWVGLISQMLGRVKRFRKAVVGETDIDAQRARHLGAEHLELERVQVREIKDLAADA